MANDKGVMDRAWDLQHRIEARQQRIGKGRYGRVLKMARKPTNEEYNRTSKIVVAGILVVGALGFVIYVIREIAIPWIMNALGY